MTYLETRTYLESISKRGSILGMESITNLMSRLDHPEEKLKVIHIAGTNGKGSVSAMLGSVFMEQGLKVGIFNSPAVFSPREIITINGVPISEEQETQVVETVKKACEEMIKQNLPQPTVFEVETAAAYEFFFEQNCDYVIMEVGLGGREDATNVIKKPLCTVITSISMDHCGILGDSLKKIAEAKAGILKEGVTAVIGYQLPEVYEVLRQQAMEKNCTTYYAEDLKLEQIQMTVEGLNCVAAGFGAVHLSLTGAAQIENLALVLQTVCALKSLGVQLEMDKINSALQKVSWPGRFQVVSRNPVFILDGAHNPDAAKKLRITLDTLWNHKKIIFIIGVLADKDYVEVLRQILTQKDVVYTITPQNARGLSGDTLLREVKNFLTNATSCSTVKEAVNAALKLAAGEDVIVAFGSLSYLSQVKDALEEEDRNGICG